MASTFCSSHLSMRSAVARRMSLGTVMGGREAEGSEKEEGNSHIEYYNT